MREGWVRFGGRQAMCKKPPCLDKDYISMRNQTIITETGIDLILISPKSNLETLSEYISLFPVRKRKEEIIWWKNYMIIWSCILWNFKNLSITIVLFFLFLLEYLFYNFKYPSVCMAACSLKRASFFYFRLLFQINV